MSFVKNFIIFLIYINSLSYALQCTTDCYFTSNLNTPFEIPETCNQTISAEQCRFDMMIFYDSDYIMFTLEALSTTYPLGDYHLATIRLWNSGLISLSYSINHRCKNKDDCAREFAEKSMRDILSRPLLDHEAIKDELLRLLSSNSSIENVDLACFDSKENVRQCGIATKPGDCLVTDLLVGRKKTNRSCTHDLVSTPQYVTIYDSSNFATFDIKCNRSLCNGPMTLQAVKEIMFKYKITKTIEGRLNHALRLSLSSTYLILIIFLLFNRFF